MRILWKREIDTDKQSVFDIKLNNNEDYTTSTEDVYVQLEDNCTMHVQGFVEDDLTGQEITLVKFDDLSTVKYATERGVYLILASAYEKLHFEFEGSSKVVIKGCD